MDSDTESVSLAILDFWWGRTGLEVRTCPIGRCMVRNRRGAVRGGSGEACRRGVARRVDGEWRGAVRGRGATIGRGAAQYAAESLSGEACWSVLYLGHVDRATLASYESFELVACIRGLENVNRTKLQLLGKPSEFL